MSLVGKKVEFDTPNGLYQGVVIDKVLGYRQDDKFPSHRYLIETQEGCQLFLIPYHKILSIVRDRVIPEVKAEDRVNLNELPGIIPKSNGSGLTKDNK